MNKQEMIDLINSDLANEYTHMLFYLQCASSVGGLHREEYREFFYKSAQSEMDHVRKFSDFIYGLGGIPNFNFHLALPHASPMEIIARAIGLEEEVLKNYDVRMKQADELNSVDGVAIRLFYEGQFEDSREDLDHLRRLAE